MGNLWERREKFDPFEVDRQEDIFQLGDCSQIKDYAIAAEDGIDGRGSNQGVSSNLKYFSCISDMEELIKGLQALTLHKVQHLSFTRNFILKWHLNCLKQ